MAIRILLLLLFTNVLLGQIPQDFEFLHHNNQNFEVGSKHVIDDGVLFVAHNGAPDMTVVAFAKNDNTQEILFKSNFYTQSKKVITQDSAVHFLLYNIFDYDVGLPGFYDITYHNGEVVVNSFSYYDDSAVSEKFINELTIDSKGNYIIDSHEREIIEFDGIDILNETNTSIRLEGIYESHDEKIYAYSDNTIYIYESEELLELQILTESILDIKKFDSFNSVLSEGQLALYDDSFNLINSFEINSLIKSLEQVSFVDSTVYTAVKNNDELLISTIQWDGNSNDVSIASNANEIIKGIDYISPNNFLISGQLVLADIQNLPSIKNLFFRHVDVENGNAYEKIDVQILDYVLTQTEKDSFPNYIDDVSNDTTWWVTYSYEINLFLLNNSDEQLFSATILQSPLWNNFGPSFLRLYELDTLLNSDDQLELNFSGISYASLDLLEKLQLFLPGANHRFNIEENIVTLPDFQSDVTNIEFNNSIKLYPNPASDFLNLTSEVAIQSYAIYNSAGQLVLARKGEAGIRRIDITNLEPGMYFLTHEEGVNQFVKE